MGPSGSPHAWLTVDQAAIDFDLVKSAPSKMNLRLRGTTVEIDLKHFIQREGYSTDDEGGPVIADPAATPDQMAFYWYGTGQGQTLHLTWHKGGVFGTSYGELGVFLLEPSGLGPFSVQVRAVNPESWTQHPEPPAEKSGSAQDLLKSRSLWAVSQAWGLPGDQPPTAPAPSIARPRFDQPSKGTMPYCAEQRGPSGDPLPPSTPIPMGNWDPSCTLEPLGAGRHLDILVLYTPAALARMQTDPPTLDPLIALRARIENEVNTTNTIFRESAIEGVQLVLKGIEPTPDNRDDGTPPVNLPPNVRAIQQLLWLVGPPQQSAPFRPATGNPAVMALREAYQADIVGMVQASFYGACGIALPTHIEYSTAVGVEPPIGGSQAQIKEPGPLFYHAAGFIADMDCAAAKWDFAHEVLHILGVQHDPATEYFQGGLAWNQSPNRPACPDAYGWRQPGDLVFADPPQGYKIDDENAYRRHRHRDLMAYADTSSFFSGFPGQCYFRADRPGPPYYSWNCPRVDRLSNRDLEWNGFQNEHGSDGWFGVEPFGTFQPPPPNNRHRIGSEPGAPDAWRGGDARFTAMRVSRLVAAYCERPDLGFENGFEAQP